MTDNGDMTEIEARDAAARHHDIPVVGGMMRWREFGSGPPLVLVHGGHGSWLHWVRNIDALSKHHTLWIPDLPGYGDSAALPPAAGAEAIVEAVARSLDTLIGANTLVDFAGFSFGGVVSARVAALRPGIRRLALLGTGGHGGTRRQSRELEQWRGLPPARQREVLSSNLAALMLHDEGAIDALAQEAYARACAATRFRSRPVSRASSIVELLEGYRQPVLFLFGEHDVTTTPEEVAPRLRDAARSRRVEVIAGGGHWVQYERAAEVDAALIAFLR